MKPVTVYVVDRYESIMLIATGSDEIMVQVQEGRTIARLILPTKHLVMAIKQVEEERDADRESTRRHSTETRIRDDEESLTAAIHRATSELREVFTILGTKSPYGKESTEIIGALSEADTVKEIDYIIRGAKEKYLRPDRSPSWREPLDSVERETETISKEAREDPYYY